MAKQKGTQDRPYWSALVVDGQQIKLRLEAERLESNTPAHVDWVRFTVLRRNVDAPSIDMLFPPIRPADCVHACYGLPGNEFVDVQRRMPIVELAVLDNELGPQDFAAAAEAFTLADSVVKALGSAFSVFSEPKKGIDFYKFRWSIELNGNEVGWVGFLASGSSPRKASQERTIHVNLHGMACTFADHGWRDKIADICDDLEGSLTRCDLALDFFEGIPGGIESIRQDYRDGLCNVGGRKLKWSIVGDWDNGHDRSVYLGSREAGKITNAYEKGDQLLGEKFNSDWLRVELRYGNKHRVLSTEMLRRPADFFAAASDWHAAMLLKLDCVSASPEPVPCIPRLPLETVKAECCRSVKWLKQTAAASMAVAFEFLGFEEFLSIVTNQKLPGRLAKFSRDQIQEQMKPAFDMQALLKLVKCPGTEATYSVESCSPAFA